MKGIVKCITTSIIIGGIAMSLFSCKMISDVHFENERLEKFLQKKIYGRKSAE